jgi:hypothetical protein
VKELGCEAIFEDERGGILMTDGIKSMIDQEER